MGIHRELGVYIRELEHCKEVAVGLFVTWLHHNYDKERQNSAIAMATTITATIYSDGYWWRSGTFSLSEAKTFLLVLAC